MSVQIAVATTIQQLRNLWAGSANGDADESREAAQVDWTSATLQAVIAEKFSGTEFIAVSNREPYTHIRHDGGIALQIPASGLVSALEPIMRACGGLWIAHGSGSADRETVDGHDHVTVPPQAPAYVLRRLWLSDAEEDGYYYGFSNEGLWPLCHLAFVRPNFRPVDWQAYHAVNRRFADAVADEARTEDPVVLVQDYHFALLPRMLRDRLPRATILSFWHIPWPNAELFGICPWRAEIVDGLLGSTILGFHTQSHCNNFLDSIDRFVESRINREANSVMRGNLETLIRPYPISIDWPPAPMATQKPISACRADVRHRLGLESDVKLAVGVERFDYTKGILERIRAVDHLLLEYPEWRGRFVLVQVAAPTRSKLAPYRRLQEEVVALASEVNARHGAAPHQPIRLLVRHHEPEEVFELFRAADCCIVSSLHDGMNLVAKEFVASRDDEKGVLILSDFAGASRELTESLLINPYDVAGMAAAFHRALTMAEDEVLARMRVLRTIVRNRNVFRWAGQMLLDAARVRRTQHIAQFNGAEKSDTAQP